MAFEHALAPLKCSFLLSHDQSRISPNSYVSLNPRFRRRRIASARVKCSFNYNGSSFASAQNNGFYQYDGESPTGQLYPRPAEIPWKKELCNSVQLIGVVGAPVQTKSLPSGKFLAWSRLGVKKSPTDTAWVNLTFWDELAYIASQHVEKGNQIYVSGRLISDTVEGDDGKQQTYYKVVVQQLNFIENTLQSAESRYRDPLSGTAARKQMPGSSTEELWQAFFANPVEWWDNRKNKKSPNYPDFKHKDTGEALWIEGRYNPSWVKSQLAVLDSRMESFNHTSKHPVNFMAVNDLGHF